METKLLPCWHCGGKAAPIGGAGNHAVKCNACGVTNERLIADETTYLGYEGYDTEAEAIKAWNTRREVPYIKPIEDGNGYFTSNRCGRCLEWLDYGWNYCPKCGVRVREEPDAD